MQAKEFIELTRRLMRHPAVAYHEHAVRAEAEAICAEFGLPCRRDRFGNLLTHLSTAPDRPALVLSAHMDHPGFEIASSSGPGKWVARFRGGVPDDYFVAGLKLRLMHGAMPAKLGRKLDGEKTFEITGSASSLAEPEFAVWDMPAFTAKEGRISGRACDDLIGASAVLATLIDLKRESTPVNVIGALTRAEEVGFHGALAMAAENVLPKDALIISLETSKEMPPVKMGQGVILRVGDKTSIFNSDGTRFLAETAVDLQKSNPHFKFQRALMGGGTCEATAYQELGYRCAAVCVALGNYHNCAPNRKIRPEFVSLQDVLSMVELLGSAAEQMPQYESLLNRLRSRLTQLRVEAQRDLPPGS